MKLLELHVENFRGAPDGTYRFASGEVPWDVVVVTGDAGSGATSLLEAIAAAKEAAGPYGTSPIAATCLRRGAERGRVEATWLLSADEQARAGLSEPMHVTSWELAHRATRSVQDHRLEQLFSSYSRDPARSKFEYFPSNRQLSPMHRPSAATDASESRVRLSRAAGKYGFLHRVLSRLSLRDGARAASLLAARGIALRAEQPDSLEPFKTALASMHPNLRLGGVEVVDRDVWIRFERRDGAALELAELSDSELQAVLFSASFVHFGLNQSVVLIDTPELHIHPQEQAGFLDRLAKLGQDNQLIVATSSDAITRASRGNQVIDLSRARGRR